MNSIIWAQIPASEYVEKKVHTEGLDIHTLFNVGKDEKRSIKNNVPDWASDYKEFNNWVRLNALMSLNSYFEIYLTTVLALAIESDPGQLHNTSKKIDGAMLLKYSNTYSYSEAIKKCAVGEWSKRIAAYEKLFRFIPPQLLAKQADLEKIRKLRNNVGHAFGRDIQDSRERGVRQIKQIERLSQERLKKYLGTVYDVVLDIDKHLLETHIGAFELIYCYHELKKSFMAKHLTAERALEIRKKLGREGPKISRVYSRAIVDYYDKL